MNPIDPAQLVIAGIIILSLAGLGLFQVVKMFKSSNGTSSSKLLDSNMLAELVAQAQWRGEVNQLLKTLSDLAREQASELHSVSENLATLSVKVDTMRGALRI